MYKSFVFSTFPGGRLLLKKRCFTAGFRCFCRIKHIKNEAKLKHYMQNQCSKMQRVAFENCVGFMTKNEHKIVEKHVLLHQKNDAKIGSPKLSKKSAGPASNAPGRRARGG